MPKKTKATKTPKKGYTICPDCGAEYKATMPHMMFCKAHTCEECGTGFSEIVQENEEGRRLCESCQNPDDE